VFDAIMDNRLMLKDLLKQLFTSKAARESAGLKLARELFQISEFDHAINMLDGLLRVSPNFAQAWCLRAQVQRKLGRPQQALADLERALALAPDDVECRLELAGVCLELGDTAGACRHCETARLLAPDDTRVFGMLANAMLPGKFYFDVLSRIIARLEPRTYVEIGVFRGDSLKLVRRAEAVVGIDPQPQLTWTLDPHMRVFNETSDAFFEKYDLTQELGGRAVDLAFIDGLHLFEFALRDFANLERCCHRNSTILIHDCYPIDALSADREPRHVNWSGDIWRLIVLLKKYRPDLEIHTIATAPTGLAIISKLDPASTFLHDNLPRLYEEFLALDYTYLETNKDEKLSLVPNDWSKIVPFLRSPKA
jgi:tetratricopeptide (TPR) repeat protein